MILMVYILTLIGTIALIFFSVDWTIELYKWQSRIHIGRWTDRKAWQQAVEKKARQWLYKSPTVQITDQDRLVLWDMLKGNYRSTTIQSWQDAGLLLSLPEQDAQEYVKRHPSLFIKENWQIDQSLLAYVLKKKDALYMETEKEIKELINKLNRLYLIGKHYLTFALSIPSDWFVPFYTNAISVI